MPMAPLMLTALIILGKLGRALAVAPILTAEAPAGQGSARHGLSFSSWPKMRGPGGTRAGCQVVPHPEPTVLPQICRPQPPEPP